MPEKWPRTPTQKEGNIARPNKDGTPDKSGDGARLPKFGPPKKS